VEKSLVAGSKELLAGDDNILLLKLLSDGLPNLGRAAVGNTMSQSGGKKGNVVLSSERDYIGETKEK
jgi:hypothetical protein